MHVLLVFIFIVVRLTVIALGIYLGYYLVKAVIEPKVLRPACLTDTNSCAYLDLWKYKNSFVAQVFPSGIYLFFSGSRCFIFGQAPGTCTNSTDYEPVDVITITGSTENPVYSRKNYECITKAASVINYYETILKVKPETVYLKDPSLQAANLNVFDIVQQLINRGMIAVNDSSDQVQKALAAVRASPKKG